TLPTGPTTPMADPAAAPLPVPAGATAVGGPTTPTVAELCAIPPEKRGPGQPLWQKALPIGVMLIVIAFVVMMLPKVKLGHSKAFRRRRLLNWLPLGLTYSFLYMARYNLKAFQ